MNLSVRSSPFQWLAFCACAAILGRFAFGRSWGWVLLVAIALVIAAGRSRVPAAPRVLWPHIAGRTGKIVGMGVLAGGLSGSVMMAVSEWMTLSAPNVDPSNLTVMGVVGDAASVLGPTACLGAALGVIVAVIATLVSLVEWRWNRAAAGTDTDWRAAPPRIAHPLASLVMLAPLVMLIIGFECVLSNDDFVSGCSSGCAVYRQSLGSRVFGGALACLTLFGAIRATCAGAVVASRKRSGLYALGALACLAITGLSLFESYTAYSSTFHTDFRFGWLGIPTANIPSGGMLSKDSRVTTEPSFLGRTLVIVQPDGSVTRARLSLGPWRLADSGKFVARVKDYAEHPDD